jgi:hypothetical protein
MTSETFSRAAAVALLRRRGQDDRADFVERELPEVIDPSRHRGLLTMLRLDPAELAEDTTA